MKIKRLLLMSGAWLGFWHGLAMADTDFILPQPTDPKAAPVVVSARNFDADHNLRYFAEVMPRGRVWHASDPDAGAGKYGWSWTNQYGFVGISYGWSANYNRGRHLDGMNEKGLSAAVIEFNDSDSLFPQPSTGNTNLSIRSVVAWVLGNFSTVQEVTNSISALQVWQEPTGYFLTFNNALQLVVHDTNSHSIVVEWFPDGPTIRGTYWVDEMRAASGDPDYVSLYGYGQNYADLNWENHMKVPVNNEMVNITDHYLPGDSWSPSRFVRANRLLRSAVDSYVPLPLQTLYPPNWRQQNADHILRRLEVVPGERRARSDSATGDPAYCTVLSLIRDHSHKDMIFRGLYDANLKKVHVEQLDFISKPETPPWMDLDPLPENALTVPAVDLSGTLASVDANYYRAYLAYQYLKLNLKINVNGMPGDLSSGSMYIFSQKTDGNYYSWTNSGWTGAIALTNLMACYSGSLSNRTFEGVFDDYVTSKILLGTKLYAGYGLSPLEMMMSGRCKLVHIVCNPHYLVYTGEE